MYLSSLKLSNFRSFDETEVNFQKKITVLVGENNGGKSNAIDALRLITPPLSGRREIYCEPTDINFTSKSSRFDIEASYLDLSTSQQGRLLSATIDATLQSARFGLTYDGTSERYPIKPSIWAGGKKSPPEPGCQDAIRHVYLPPLRDAKRALASGNPTRIYALLKHFLDGELPDALAQRLKRIATDPILTKVDNAVDIGLGALTTGVRRQSASLGFAGDEKLIDIARDLRFKLADHGIAPEDLRYSGHGYANLLYMATIAVELEKVNDADLTLFLVEEPEAHLHPQLQAAVLSFLEEQSEKTQPSKPGAAAGQVQIVVATHSPNLSAWNDSKNLVVFRSCVVPVPVEPLPSEPAIEDDAAVGPDAAPAPAPVLRRTSRCIPLEKISLSDPDRRKVDRYLDVTRSALLFGGRAMLVEGIAEALLLPVIAKNYVLKGKADKMRLFRSAVFLPIDGVDFRPYVTLLLTPYDQVRISDRVVVITDGDAHKEAVNGRTPGDNRKHELDTLATALSATSVFSAAVSTYSLETELVNAGNADLLKSVYLSFHPKSEHHWTAAIGKTGHDRASAIQELFKSTRKGDFAQILAEKIQADGATFVVPQYIRDAIEAIVL
ncbi:AAA family ATPase [Bosea sp. 124]|uniref:ATP-dependent nuclease n=1 Tax=Bosea sp. 124 TaxID=2135642 RepID=UPI000D370C01|nr:AAA family ATPase [Bosea sp. 124]PTM40519.1 putative ATP-dependent endonuclease of OLD family [Bosea sp. 124]